MDHQPVQRTFAAKNLAEGQKGVLLTGFLKLLGRCTARHHRLPPADQGMP